MSQENLASRRCGGGYKVIGRISGQVVAETANCVTSGFEGFGCRFRHVVVYEDGKPWPRLAHAAAGSLSRC